MKTMCWNVRRLGNPKTFRSISHGIRHHNPILLFFMETKCKANAKNINKIKRSFNYSGCFAMDCNGRSGGLCLLWKEEMNVTIRSFSQFHIDASVLWDPGLYGNPNTNQRKFTWDLICILHNQDESAWIIGGDFNATLSYEEKEGGAPTRESQMDMFRNVLDECELQDLDYLSEMYTWSNRHMCEVQINE